MCGVWAQCSPWYYPTSFQFLQPEEDNGSFVTAMGPQHLRTPMREDYKENVRLMPRPQNLWREQVSLDLGSLAIIIASQNSARVVQVLYACIYGLGQL